MIEIDGNNDDDAAQPTPPFHQTLTLALPIQHAANSNGIAAAPAASRDDTWSDGATSALIDAWAHRYLDLGRGILKPHHWQEVAAAVASSKTEIQCKHRIEALKKRYRSEKSKLSSSSWPYFDRLDRLLGANLKAPPPAPLPPAAAAGPQFPQKMRTPTTTTTAAMKSKKRSRSPKIRDGQGISVLMDAITRFGEVYERVERASAEREVEMEKQRMGFVREVEMQRMQFISQLKLQLHSNLKWEGTPRRRRLSP